MAVNPSSVMSKASGLGRVAAWFKPLFVHLKNSAVVLAALGLLIVLVLLWWLGPKWEINGKLPLEPVLVRSVITLGLVFLVSTIVAIHARYKLKKIRQAEEKAQREKEDPVLPFIEAMERQFNQTMSELRTTTIRRDFLYVLPWYMVIGAENSGKTSLINRSNQSFTQSTYSNTKKRRGEVELPYKIDWWIGNDAVIIDPDGELISDKPLQGYEEYEQFPQRIWDHCIDWLEYTRSRRPLNGIVLAIDLPAILVMSVSDRKHYADLLRVKLRDLIEKLGTRLPVYVVLTKFDLLDGFDAFFDNLPRSAREQIFGFTFSLDALHDADSWLDELDQHYEKFLGNLNDAVFDALAKAHNQQARNELFSFSRQLAGFKDTLLEFLSEILESDRYATAALVRGLYFTSVYQQGIPHNTYVQAAAVSFKLPARIEAAKSIQRSITYFSKSLFQDVIYPEAGLAGDNIRVARSKRRVFLLASVVAVLIAILTVGGWQHYYDKNIEASETVLVQSKKFMESEISDQIDVTGRNLLQPLNDIRIAISAYGRYRDKFPLLADMGLYQGGIIGPKVEETYLNLLETRYLPALSIGLVDQINLAEKGSDEKLAALRVYRMIQDKSNRRKQIVMDWMATEWHKHYEGQGETQRQLLLHLDYAMDFVEANLPQFDGLVRQSQYELRQVALPQRVYHSIKQDSQAELHNIVDVRQRIGPSFDLIYKHEQEKDHPTDYQIDAIFTSPAYKSYFVERNKSVVDLAVIDQWVLGERNDINYSEQDKDELADKIRSHYINDYLDTWKRTLGRLEVNEFDDVAYAVKVLETLTGSTAPLHRLIEMVMEHSRIYPEMAIEDEREGIEAEKELLKDPDRRQAKRILRNFKGLIGLLEKGDKELSYYEELMQALAGTYEYMAGVQSAPDRGKAALKVARDRFQLDGADPIYTLERVAAGLPEPLSAQMQKVAKESWKVLLVKALQQLEKKWDEEIYEFYRERLASRYPFNPNAKDEASLEDFELLFGPQGKLNEFYEKYLKVFLHDNLSALYSEEDEDYLVDTGVLEQLKAAWDIQDGFFDPRGALILNFSLEPLALSANKRRSLIDIDGQLVPYNHGPAHSSRLIWPNTFKQSAESKITMIGKDGKTKMIRYQGPWSWFRLLEKAQINGANNNMLDVTFRLGDGRMRYRVYSEKSNSPILRQLFKGFSLPRTLLRKRPAPSPKRVAVR